MRVRYLEEVGTLDGQQGLPWLPGLVRVLSLIGRLLLLLLRVFRKLLRLLIVALLLATLWEDIMLLIIVLLVFQIGSSNIFGFLLELLIVVIASLHFK